MDYVQQDMTGQPVNQTAETLAILVDTTAGAAELLAAKTIIKQVLITAHTGFCLLLPLVISVGKLGSSLGACSCFACASCASCVSFCIWMWKQADCASVQHHQASGTLVILPVFMQLLQRLPRAWRVALLTFGSAVSVYQLGHTGLVTADVVSGEWQPVMTSSKQKQQQQHAALPIHHTDSEHVASLQSCQGVAENVVDSWRCVVGQITFCPCW